MNQTESVAQWPELQWDEIVPTLLSIPLPSPAPCHVKFHDDCPQTPKTQQTQSYNNTGAKDQSSSIIWPECSVYLKFLFLASGIIIDEVGCSDGNQVVLAAMHKQQGKRDPGCILTEQSNRFHHCCSPSSLPWTMPDQGIICIPFNLQLCTFNNFGINISLSTVVLSI